MVTPSALNPLIEAGTCPPCATAACRTLPAASRETPITTLAVGELAATAIPGPHAAALVTTRGM